MFVTKGPLHIERQEHGGAGRRSDLQWQEGEPRKTPRAQSVYRALRRAILEQALRPGMKLPEDSIGEELGVSRTLVRDAFGGSLWKASWNSRPIVVPRSPIPRWRKRAMSSRCGRRWSGR